MRLVYLTGIDGAGKTTLAHTLVQDVQSQGVESHYMYAQHIPFLLAPLKWLAQRSFIRSTNAKNDYAAYSVRKTEASRRYSKLSRLYAVAWLIDYFCMTYWRLLPHLFRHSWLVVDRYYFDIVTNISQTLGLSTEQAVALAQKVSKFFPTPEIILYIDLPEEVAFARKNDIAGVEYLRERRQWYRTLGKTFKFVYLNGNQSPAQVHQDALNQLEHLLPYNYGGRGE